MAKHTQESFDTEPEFQIETRLEAQARRDGYVSVLLGHGTTNAQRLGRRLKECSTLRSCGSGACPLCLREYRLSLLDGFEADLNWYRHLTRVSVVPKGGRVAAGKLKDFDLDKWVAAASKNLERKGPDRSWALFGVDVSWNVGKEPEPYWQMHLYGVAAKLEGENFDWSGVFPLDKRDDRPLKRGDVGPTTEDRQKVVSYMLKGYFNRRSSYRGSRNPKARSGWKTRPFDIKPAQLPELLLFLDRYPIRTRLIGHRVRINERCKLLNFQISNRLKR